MTTTIESRVHTYAIAPRLFERGLLDSFGMHLHAYWAPDIGTICMLYTKPAHAGLRRKWMLDLSYRSLRAARLSCATSECSGSQRAGKPTSIYLQ